MREKFSLPTLKLKSIVIAIIVKDYFAKCNYNAIITGRSTKMLENKSEPETHKVLLPSLEI